MFSLNRLTLFCFSGDILPGFASGDFFIFGPTKVPSGDYFLFFLGFLSKSKSLFWALLRYLLGNMFYFS